MKCGETNPVAEKINCVECGKAVVPSKEGVCPICGNPEVDIDSRLQSSNLEEPDAKPANKEADTSVQPLKETKSTQKLQPHSAVRPKSITIIAWIMILAYGSGMILITGMGLAMILDSSIDTMISGINSAFGISPAVQMLSAIIGTISLISGIAVLKGANWGKLAFLWVYPVQGIISYITFQSLALLIAPTIFYAIVLFVFTRPTAVKYFKTS